MGESVRRLRTPALLAQQVVGVDLCPAPASVYGQGMASEELVSAVKKIVAAGKAGKVDEAYTGYRDLFASPAFPRYEANDQRQALRLMVMAKGAPSAATPAMIDAHKAAVPVLTKLVAAHGDPADHELLGICHVLLGDEEKASAVFRQGLTIERERNPQSDLCGALMKRVSLL
jgi:hypothetical protein